MGDTLATDGDQVFRCQKNPNIELHELSIPRVIQLLTGSNLEFPALNYVFFLTERNAGNLSNEDSYALELLSQRQVPWVLLRTHADLLVTEEQKQLTLNREREALGKSLRQRNLEPLVKLVDAKSVVEFEYLKSLEDLLNRVDEMQRVSLVNSLEVFEQVSSLYCFSFVLAEHSKNVESGSVKHEFGTNGMSVKEILKHSID